MCFCFFLLILCFPSCTFVSFVVGGFQFQYESFCILTFVF